MAEEKKPVAAKAPKAEKAPEKAVKAEAPKAVKPAAKAEAPKAEAKAAPKAEKKAVKAVSEDKYENRLIKKYHDQVVPTLIKKFGYTSIDRKSTRLNSSHQIISYAVFCLKK